MTAKLMPYVPPGMKMISKESKPLGKNNIYFNIFLIEQ
jgi:hypothetical protein